MVQPIPNGLAAPELVIGGERSMGCVLQHFWQVTKLSTRLPSVGRRPFGVSGSNDPWRMTTNATWCQSGSRHRQAGGGHLEKGSGTTSRG